RDRASKGGDGGGGGAAQGDLQNAVCHLLGLLDRAARDGGLDEGLRREIRRVQGQTERASGDAELEAAALAAQELRWPASLATKGTATAAAEPFVDAAIPVARALGLEGMDDGLRRLRDATAKAEEAGDTITVFRQEMERVAHGVVFLRQTADVLRLGVSELVDILGELAADEPAAQLRLQKVRQRIERAADLRELEQLREALVQEASALVEEAQQRGERAEEARTLMRVHESHAKVLELALKDATAMASTDALTGLGNRRAVDRFVKRQRSSREEVGLVAVDIDHFKKVNDTHGHDAGDVVLRHVAETLRAELRGNDHAYRTGGEEFLVLLPGTDLEGTQRTAERLREQVERQLLRVEGQTLRVTLSGGAAMWRAGTGFKHATKAADAALYEAKRMGRNRIVTARDA
ncbi:MAG: GGDEF domain-containing protein, partial [Myxococcota bacterium]